MTPDLFEQMSAAQTTHWWFRARRSVLHRLIAALGLPEHSRILEIGAGTGGNLSMLRAHGSVLAVEHDMRARALAARDAGTELLAGALPDALPPLPRRHFDLICLLDVLEHVEQDRAALQAIAELLRPGGLLLVTVPAYQWLFGNHDRLHGHFRRYSAAEIARKARDAGLQLRRCGYFNTLLFPLVVLARLGAALRRSDASPGLSIPHRRINAVLHAVFAAEARVVPYRLFPFGTSVVAVLEAP